MIYDCMRWHSGKNATGLLIFFVNALNSDRYLDFLENALPGLFKEIAPHLLKHMVAPRRIPYPKSHIRERVTTSIKILAYMNSWTNQ